MRCARQGANSRRARIPAVEELKDLILAGRAHRALGLEHDGDTEHEGRGIGCGQGLAQAPVAGAGAQAYGTPAEAATGGQDVDPAHPGGSFDVVVPSNQKLYTVRNLSGGPVTLGTGGGTGVTVADGEVRLLYVDGIDVVDLSPAASGGVAALEDLSDVDRSTAPPASGDGLRWSGSLWVPASRGLDIGVFVPDRPDAGGLVIKLVVVRAFTLPAGLTGSRGHAGAAATAQADLDIRQNGS